uniref:Uncharacterized protein n=1 Tax=Glossina pallidipes TaxID=7398 RepID=A0A1B0AFP9_GLOPL
MYCFDNWPHFYYFIIPLSVVIVLILSRKITTVQLTHNSLTHKKTETIKSSKVIRATMNRMFLLDFEVNSLKVNFFYDQFKDLVGKDNKRERRNDNQSREVFVLFKKLI